MTIRACRKAVFSLLLMMLFSLLLTGVNAEFCITLTSSSTKNDTLNCANAKMQLQEVGGKYPIADFSGYSQSDFEEAMRNKNQDGDDIGGNRLFGGNFLAKKSKLSNITIGFYTPRKNIPQSFVLKDNWNLREVTITETEQLLNYNIIMEFTIRNNKRLSEKSINHLKSIPYKLNTSYIQDPGECEFYGVALDSIGDLEDCQKIIGDLIIGSSTQITGMDKIKTLREIHGCLRIKESQIENVDFLNKVTFRDCTKHEITGNKKLCINPEDVSDLNKTLSNALTYKGSDDCEGFCRSEYFLEHKEKACVHIKGKVTINKDYEGDDLSYLSQVKTIKGRLVIRNTNFTNVDFFPKLETVDDSGSQEQDSQIVGTIEIIYNNMLKNVSFPALNTITVGQDTTKKLYVEGNGGNHLPDEVREYFENKFGKGSVLISRLEPPPPPPGRLTHQEEEEAEEERKRKEEKESSTRGIAISVGVIGGVVLLIIIPVTTFFCIRAVRHRNEIKRKQKNYNPVDKTPLGVPNFKLPKYPKQLPWIKEANDVILKNVDKIKKEAERQEEVKLTDWLQLTRKNSEAVAPIRSRCDAELNKHNRHWMSGSTPQACKGTKKQKGKIFGCINKKHDGGICRTACECMDHGVHQKSNDTYVFGIRMENAHRKWRYNELEFNHDKHPKYELPITYEENSKTTMERMIESSTFFIENELEWQKEMNIQDMHTGISSNGIRLSKKEREEVDKIKASKLDPNRQIPEGERTKCTSYLHRVEVCRYYASKNELKAIKNIPVNKEIPSLWESFWCCSCCTRKDENLFYDNMIYAHMNAPTGQWVENFKAEDMINLCTQVKEIITDANHFGVVVHNCNVRIIGQLLGDFDSLRKGLCFKSVNEIKGEHPICNVKHIFLGNLVGPKGSSLNVLCLLFALKCRYPKNYIFLRGLMEWDEMEEVSGLKKEIVARFSEGALDVYEAIMGIFENLPFTCTVGKNLLCTHAGIAPLMQAQFANVKMPIKELVPDTLPFNLMFAQPNYTVKRFFDNVEQGAGYYFGDESMDDTIKTFNATVLICTKPLTTGYGVFGQSDSLMFAICGTSHEGGHIAQVEFDERGLMHIQVIV